MRTSSDWQTVKPSVNSADIIVDALAWHWRQGALEGLLSEVIREVNGRGRGKVVVAVDIPSGLPADGDRRGPESQCRNERFEPRHNHRRLHSHIHGAEDRNVFR